MTRFAFTDGFLQSYKTTIRFLAISNASLGLRPQFMSQHWLCGCFYTTLGFPPTPLLLPTHPLYIFTIKINTMVKFVNAVYNFVIMKAITLVIKVIANTFLLQHENNSLTKKKITATLLEYQPLHSWWCLMHPCLLNYPFLPYLLVIVRMKILKDVNFPIFMGNLPSIGNLKHSF